MAQPTTSTLYKAIQAKNAPGATQVFNELIQSKLRTVMDREYRSVAQEFFTGPKRITEGKIDRKAGESDSDYFERLTNIWSGTTKLSPDEEKQIVATMDKLDASITADFFGGQNSKAHRGLTEGSEPSDAAIAKFDATTAAAWKAYQKGKAGPGCTWAMLSKAEKAALAAGKKLS